MEERDTEAEFWRIIAATWTPPERRHLKLLMQAHYFTVLGRRF